jgi:ribose 5-phosphate isomerase B
MKIALCSDEPYPVHELVRKLVEKRGDSVLVFGSVATGREHPWAKVAEEAALAVAEGRADEGIFFCWSGTGICMAANKVPKIRAALCSDPGQVRAARVWNHANVLCLSNRTLSDDMAKEMLAAWFETESDQAGASGVEIMKEVDLRHRTRGAGPSQAGGKS